MLQTSFIFLVGLCATVFGLKRDHAIYLSVAEVVHEQGKTDAQIKIKVFTNDMEDALLNEFRQKIGLSDTALFGANKKYIQQYFSQHIELTIDNKKQNLNLSRAELTGDAIWFYFDTICAINWKEVTVKADYLMELFPTQSNVISIEHSSKKQFIRLTNNNKIDTITF